MIMDGGTPKKQLYAVTFESEAEHSDTLNVLAATFESAMQKANSAKPKGCGEIIAVELSARIDVE